MTDMTARDMIAARLAYIECGVTGTDYVSDGNRIDAADIMRSLEDAGYRVVPADLVTNAEAVDTVVRVVADGIAQPERAALRASVAAARGDDPLEVFAGNP